MSYAVAEVRPPRIDSSAGSLQSRASVTLAHRLLKVRKQSQQESSRNNGIISSNPLMSGTENSRKNLLANCFLKFG